jgi:hypothetical protein
MTELTFIIHSRSTGGELALSSASMLGLPMVGDVNIFLKGSPSDEDFEVEVEIMIAGSSIYPSANPWKPILIHCRVVLPEKRLRYRITPASSIIRYRSRSVAIYK